MIRADDFQLGDPTLSILELWGAEYQESDAILLQPKHSDQLKAIGLRERCPVCFVGSVTGNGKVRTFVFLHPVIFYIGHFCLIFIKHKVSVEIRKEEYEGRKCSFYLTMH